MPKPPFATVWNRIVTHSGERFSTKTGKAFTFTVDKNYIHTSRTDYPLSRANIESAYKEAPFDGPGIINNTIRGPAYVWAILHDARIRDNDW